MDRSLHRFVLVTTARPGASSWMDSLELARLWPRQSTVPNSQERLSRYV
jgi:hypothetical protein